MRTELERLATELRAYQTTHQQTAQELEATVVNLKEARDERAFWEEFAAPKPSGKSRA
ncbi:MAG: hypothetical protein U0X75_12965 [Acidobacteriota bacterium]